MQHAATHLFIFFGVIVLLPFLYPIFLMRTGRANSQVATRNSKTFAVVFGVLVVVTLAISVIKTSLA